MNNYIINTVCMQYKDEKMLHLIKEFGKCVRKRRMETTDKSLTLFSYEYDLDSGNLSRIENGLIEPKLTMLWRIAEALDMKLSDLIKLLENELGDNFFVIEK